MRKILNRINGLISAKIESRVQKGAQDAMLFKCISKNRINAKIANYEGTGAGVTDKVSERGDSRISALCNVVSKTSWRYAHAQCACWERFTELADAPLRRVKLRIKDVKKL